MKKAGDEEAPAMKAMKALQMCEPLLAQVVAEVAVAAVGVHTAEVYMRSILRSIWAMGWKDFNPCPVQNLYGRQ